MAVKSFDVVNTKAASDEKIAAFKTSSCPTKVRKHIPFMVLQIFFVVLQIFAVASSDAVRTSFPSELNTAVATPLAWPTNVIKHFPLVALHIFTAVSSVAVSTRRPSGENVTSDKLLSKWAVCPESVETHAPVVVFQMRQIPSGDGVSAAVASFEI